MNPPPEQALMTSENIRATPGAKAGDATLRGQNTKKFDRKLVEILRTAAEVFAEVGYDAASIRLVAERAGVSVAGLYHYVRSKNELLYLIQYHVFDGLVRRFVSDNNELLAAGGDAARPETRLKRFIRNHLDHFLTDMASLTVCTRELGRLDDDYLKQVEALQRAYFSQAFEIFQELCDLRNSSRTNPRTVTLAMFGTINWVSSWYDPGSDSTADELAEEFLNLYLHGIGGSIEPSVGSRSKTADLPPGESNGAVSGNRDRGKA